MNDPSTYWLTQTNIFLGVVVLVCCIAVVIGIAQEVAAHHKRRAHIKEIEREIENDMHVFDTPGLGITMADGGEPRKK